MIKIFSCEEVEFNVYEISYGNGNITGKKIVPLENNILYMIISKKLNLISL